MATLKYPNLELLEYKALEALYELDSIKGIIGNKKAANRWFGFNMAVEVFIQTWASTATAFDVTEDGHATVGGSAMTEAYTVVFHERETDSYAIFVSDRLCYIVEKSNKEFLNDLANRDMKPKSKAKQYYECR